MRPGSILNGISALIDAREIVSTANKKKAPKTMANGSKRWLLGPTSILEKCGITRPTQPIVPLMQTEQAVRTVAHRIIA